METITAPQKALRDYYRAILALEDTGVISSMHGDALSSEMMNVAGDWEEYDS